MAEGARLESVYTATYRGFESPPAENIKEKSPYLRTGSHLEYGGEGVSFSNPTPPTLLPLRV
uniref:hypothetical protein n=1 Tax=Klebsiella pneumoniae TaxID=573 RepID=UPI001E4E8843